MTRQSTTFSVRFSTLSLSEDAKKQLSDQELLALDFCGVDRHLEGTPDSQMVSSDIRGRVKPGMIYEFRFENGQTDLVPIGHVSKLTEAQHAQLDRSIAKRDGVRVEQPESTKFTVDWKADHGIVETDEAANILGDNHAGVVKGDANIEIPAVEATKETLKYYGAHLLEHGDYIEFEFPEGWTADFPIFGIDTGFNYFQTYQEETGHYIEEHNLPHYHCPAKSSNGGFYMLGKFTTEYAKPTPKGEKEIQVSGFRIPFGTAVYTPFWTLHNDGGLYGDITCGYYVASEFTTCILMQNQGEDLAFAPMEFTGKVAELDTRERNTNISAELYTPKFY